MEPAVTDRVCRCFGILPVASNDMRTADEEFALLVVGAFRTVAADDLHVDVEERITNRSDLLLHHLRREPEVVARSLGEPVAHLEVDAAIPELLHDRKRAGSAAADDEFQF